MENYFNDYSIYLKVNIYNTYIFNFYKHDK